MMNLAQLLELHAAGKLIGLFEVENQAYHDGPGVSQSTLKEFKISAAHAKAKMDKRREPTDAMELGTAFHCAILEPKRFDASYVAAPAIKRNSNAGKEAYAAWESENKGKLVLDADDLATVKAMREKVREHEVAAKLTGEVIIETAAYWIDEVTGVLCKCKPDAIVPSEGVILDPKSTKDRAIERDFLRAVGNFGYHIQAPFYIDGVKEALRQSVGLQSVAGQSVGLQFSPPERFVFLVAEKSEPYGVDLFELDDADMALGRDLYHKYLQELAICRMENHWPSYPKGIKKLGRLPAWAA